MCKYEQYLQNQYQASKKGTMNARQKSEGYERKECSQLYKSHAAHHPRLSECNTTRALSAYGPIFAAVHVTSVAQPPER